MTDIITEAVTEAEAVVEGLVHDAEELFPPKPGGMVDRFRKARAAEEQRKAEQDGVITETGRRQVHAVRVQEEPANIARAVCVLLTSTAQVRRLLPRDSMRRSAVILAIDNDVYLAHDPGTAWNVQGATSGTGAFYLPAGIAIPVDSTAELWAACTTTATNSRVSVLINRDSA